MNKNETNGKPGVQRTRGCAGSEYLPPICWVHRPKRLRGKIEEADDLCPKCCEKRVQKYRAEYPDDASEIIVDGGWEQCRESEELATCSDCGCDLGCYLLETLYDVSEWDYVDRCIDTPAKAAKARERLSEQQNKNPNIAVSGGGGADVH